MISRRDSAAVPISRLDVAAYTIPTSSPESDGTLQWDRTTIVIVEAHADVQHGIGYTYADDSVATLIRGKLAPLVTSRDAMDVAGAWDIMVRSIRNLGRPGICSMAIAAVDAALWDLKARLLGISLGALLGRTRESIPVYGSGGFTSYTDAQLQAQLGGWAEEGIRAVKMKVGREPERDPQRVNRARQAIGDNVTLMVDANGAYTRKQALRLAEQFAHDYNVRWFEEPVSSDDLEGLHLLRNQAPLEIAAGEYGYDLPYFRNMLQAEAVDVLQADATRCAGITGLLQVGALCAAWCLPLSAHTAPTLHAQPMCALTTARDVEYFHDHVRIERKLFDGALVADDGELRPDWSRPGLGIEFKRADAERFAA